MLRTIGRLVASLLIACVGCVLPAHSAGAPAAGTSPAAKAEPSVTATLQWTACGARASPIRIGSTVCVLVGGVSGITVQNGRATNVHLALAGVLMSSFDDPLAVATKDGLILQFHVRRDANKEDSRREWTKVLEQQHDGYEMQLPMALAIGAAPAIDVGPGDAKFFFTTQACAYWSLGIGVVLFCLLFWGMKSSNSMLRDHPGGPYSLGKSQMAFWGLLVALSVVGLFLSTQMLEHVPEQVLILVGISGATGLGALLIGSSTKSAEITKLREQIAALPAADPQQPLLSARLQVLVDPPSATSRGFFQDLVDDGNGASFHRVQALMWTLILGAYFLWSVSQVMAMPEFSATLLTLMGISNAIYLGFKFPEPS